MLNIVPANTLQFSLEVGELYQLTQKERILTYSPINPSVTFQFRAVDLFNPTQKKSLLPNNSKAQGILGHEQQQQQSIGLVVKQKFTLQYSISFEKFIK